MEAMPLSTMADACGGKFLQGDPGVCVTRLVTDSRADCAGAMFVAFVGERFDGHDYVAKVSAAGAVGAFVSKDMKYDVPGNFALVMVEDTLAAYQVIARTNRDRYGVPVVAITGSCGKTTTKSILFNLLSGRRTVCTEKNENNEVGVPLTVLRMDGSTERVIVEFGMRGPGEIRQLARTARPTHGIITNIEPAHIGRLGSLEAIADAKGELLEEMGAGDFAFLNADNEWTERLRKKTSASITTFGIDKGDVRAAGINYSLDGTRFMIETPSGRIEACVPLPGRGTVYNAAAAAAVALSLGESPESISERLALPAEEGSRMRIVRSPCGMLLIDDTYNSSPASLRLALELLGSVAWNGRRVAVIGDMLELGEFSHAEHLKIGKETASRNAGVLVTFGEEARAFAEGAASAGMARGSIFSFTDFDALAEEAEDIFHTGDMVLIKGSRGMKMERIVNLLGEM